MKQIKKIILPCLLLVMVFFISCSNIIDGTDTVDIDNFIDVGRIVDGNAEIYSVTDIQFLKAKGYHIGESGLPWLEEAYLISECNVVDTLYLRCSVQLPDWPALSHQVAAKVTSEKTGDVTYIGLLQDAGFGYIQPVPPPPLVFLGCIFLSDEIKKDIGKLRVSPDGDVLTVEIMYKDGIVKQSIPVTIGTNIVDDIILAVDSNAIDVNEISSVNGIQFLKANGYHIVDEIGLPWLELAYLISECKVVDTLYLRCSVQLPYWPAFSQSVLVKVTSEKTGDIKNIYLLQDAGFGYIQPVPPPPLVFLGRIFLSDPSSGKAEELRVSPDGDVLTVEIMYKDGTVKQSIPVKPQ